MRRVALPRGIVDHRPSPPAVAAAAALVPLRSQAEVDAWTVKTSDEAKAGMSELSLTRKGLTRAPDPAMFLGVKILKLSRNRVARLPEETGEHMPCLERLEASCNVPETLPASVGTLMFLEHLDVSGNLLRHLPSMCGAQAGFAAYTIHTDSIAPLASIRLTLPVENAFKIKKKKRTSII